MVSKVTSTLPWVLKVMNDREERKLRGTRMNGLGELEANHSLDLDLGACLMDSGVMTTPSAKVYFCINCTDDLCLHTQGHCKATN